MTVTDSQTTASDMGLNWLGELASKHPQGRVHSSLMKGRPVRSQI